MSILLRCHADSPRVLRSGAPGPPLPWTGSAVASGRALPIYAGIGRGAGVGRGLGVAFGRAVGVGLTVAVGVAVGVTLGVAVAVAVAVAVGVACCCWCRSRRW